MKLVELEAAVVWPVDVPTFRQAREQSHTHSPAELDLIEAAISQAEQIVDAPFGDEIPKADVEHVATVIARLQTLPSDLFLKAEREAKEARIPNLRSGRCNVRDLDRLERIVVDAEQEMGRRVNELLGPLAANNSIDLTGAGSALEEGATA